MDNRKVFNVLRIVLQVIINIIVVPFLPLLISGRWGWWEAWVSGLLLICGFVISRGVAKRRTPGLLEERADFMRHAGIKPWDKVLVPLIALAGGLVFVYAGLDKLFSWSGGGLGWPVRGAGLVFLLFGYVFSSYALVENPFFSGVVRIQAERGHTVVSSGPYRLVRHPGYLGGILVYLGIPLFLDSILALFPGIFLMVALVYRTYMEDKVLQEELEGYRAYTLRVRWRLLPLIW